MKETKETKKMRVWAHDCAQKMIEKDCRGRACSAQKGITLIALVITIIVMLILVAVTISMAVNGGLFEYAGKATGETQNAIDKEQTLASGGVTIGNTPYSSIDEYIKKDDIQTIPTTESYVGCYADVDGDGDVDGVIYADLAVGNTGDGQWFNSMGKYTIPTETGLKDYYVSQTDYVGTFGTEARDVITAIGGEGKERFYVMALSDITADFGDIIFSGFYWYSSAYGNMSDFTTATLNDFGTGKANTAKIKGYWEAKTPYGEQNARDLWAQIDSECEWFVPSIAEWAAFAEELGIISSNFSDFGLTSYYWSSSQNGPEQAFYADFLNGYPTTRNVNERRFVRLSTTF